MSLLDSVLDEAADKAVNTAIVAAADEKINNEGKKKSSVGAKIFRFFFTLFWLVVVIGVDVAAFVVLNPIIGAVIEFALFLITFIIPYLRKKGSYTRYWGWLALLSAISLAVYVFQNGGGGGMD